MTVSDRFILRVSGFLSLLFLSFCLVKNWGVAALIALLLSIGLDRGLALLSARKRALKKTSVKDLEELFALMGPRDQQEFFFRAIPSSYSPELSENSVTFFRNGEKVLLLPVYKFSPIGYDDVAKALREATTMSSEKILILGKKPSKEVLLFSKKFSIFIDFIPTKKVSQFLYRQNKLPKRIFPISERNEKFTFKSFFEKIKEKKMSEMLNTWKTSFLAILSEAFARRRVKYYLWTSLSLAVVSLFVPWKIYYVTFSAIALTMAIICLVREPT